MHRLFNVLLAFGAIASKGLPRIIRPNFDN